MKEVYVAALSAVNLPMTILLAIIILYWLTVILGLFNLETPDFDADAEVEIDLDADADADADAESGSGGLGGMKGILYFFHVGQLPLMVLLSFIILFMWMGSLLGNHYLKNSSFLISMAMLIPLFIGSLLVTKVLTIPLVRVFRHMNVQEQERRSMLGKICQVTLGLDDGKLGQAEINIQGDPILINVKAKDGKDMHPGDRALVSGYEKDGNFYIIEPF